MRLPEIGDVVRWDRVWSRDISHDPCWVIVVDKHNHRYSGHYLFGGGFKRQDYERDYSNYGVWMFTGTSMCTSVARGVVVPPERWTDEVCAAVAKCRLTCG